MADFFLDQYNVVQRLLKEWREHGKIIIAYDFDDTVFDFHKRGDKYNDVISLLQRCKRAGAHFIVFTCCHEGQYDDIREYLHENLIPYDKINENMDFTQFGGRKVYYNILLDDRAGLHSSYYALLEAVSQIEKGLT